MREGNPAGSSEPRADTATCGPSLPSAKLRAAGTARSPFSAGGRALTWRQAEGYKQEAEQQRRRQRVAAAGGAGGGS